MKLKKSYTTKEFFVELDRRTKHYSEKLVEVYKQRGDLILEKYSFADKILAQSQSSYENNLNFFKFLMFLVGISGFVIGLSLGIGFGLKTG